MFDLTGKTALITGGASGIGAAIATAFHDQGARVVVLDRDLEAARHQAESLGVDARSVECDVTSEESIARALAGVEGQVDILVNCAGVALLDAVDELAPDSWRTTVDVNLTGTFLMCRAVGSRMKRGGRIINMASQAGSVAIERHAAYCASKFGVIGLTKVLAVEWGGRGITANTISPTVVMTELGRKAWAGPVGDAHKAEIPAARFADPGEIAAAAVYLASEEAAMVNGTDLVVDGGFTAH